VVEPPPYLANDPAHREADGDAARRRDDEEPARVDEREGSGDDRKDRDAVEHETGAVVHETLALDDRDKLPRDSQPLRDRRRSDRGGGRDDRAEHEGALPRQAVDEGVRD